MCQELGIEIRESTVGSSDSNNVESKGGETGAKSVASDLNVRKEKKSKKRALSKCHESSSEVGEKCVAGVTKRKKRKITSEGKNVGSDSESKSEEIAKPKWKVKRNNISSDTSSSSSSTSDGHADGSAYKPVFIPGKCISYTCPECKFTANSFGKVYSHMVDNHNVSKLVCEYCKFSMKNSTSMYNHTMKYCHKISGETRKQETEEDKNEKPYTCPKR